MSEISSFAFVSFKDTFARFLMIVNVNVTKVCIFILPITFLNNYTELEKQKNVCELFNKSYTFNILVAYKYT